MARLMSLTAAFLLACNSAYCQPSFGFTYVPLMEGATITHVFKNSPAEKAGLKLGDLIIKVNRVRIDTGKKESKTAVLLNAPLKTELILGDYDEDGTVWAIDTVMIIKEERSHFLNKCLEGDCVNGRGKHIDLEGSVYTGSFKNGKREGTGKLAALNGLTYEGNWKAGKKEGKGKAVFVPPPFDWTSRRWEYEGDWKADMMTGSGKFRYHDSSFYAGMMKDNARNGWGKMVQKDGTAYEGEWKSDILIGKGVVTYANGDTRTGNFVDGKMDGPVSIYQKATNTTKTVIFKDGRQLKE